MTKGYRVPPEHVADRGFHGTDYDFTGKVLPKSAHGNAHFGISGSDDTYFLPAQGGDTNERQAWSWTRQTDSAGAPGGQRFRVHVTAPAPEQHIDFNLHGRSEPTMVGYRENARVAPYQDIVDTRWAPPPHTGRGETHVESTLPHINWRQHGAPNWLTHHGNGEVHDENRNVVRESLSTREAQGRLRQYYDRAEDPARRPPAGQLPLW